MASDRWDNVVVGVILGFLSTTLGFLIYGLIFTKVIMPMKSMSYYLNELFLGTEGSRSKILSLSLIAVVPVFFLFSRMNRMKTMRGLLISMFLIAMVIVVLLF